MGEQIRGMRPTWTEVDEAEPEITLGIDLGMSVFTVRPCAECGDPLPQHKMGCLTPEVAAGRMTPRQRQILLLEAAERERTPEQRLREAIDAAGRNGGRIERIVLGQRAWQALATFLPNGASLTPRHGLQPSQAKYAGYPIIVSPDVDPDEILAVRAPDSVTGFSNVQGSSVQLFKNTAANYTP